MYPLELEVKKKKGSSGRPPKDQYKVGYLKPPTAPPPTEPHGNSRQPPRSKKKTRKNDHLAPPLAPPPTEPHGNIMDSPRSKKKTRKNDDLTPPPSTPQQVETFSSIPIELQLSYNNHNNTTPSTRQVNYTSNNLTPLPKAPQSKNYFYNDNKLNPPPGSPGSIPPQASVVRTPPSPGTANPPPPRPNTARPPMPMRRGLTAEQLSRSRLVPAPTTNYSNSGPAPGQPNYQMQSPQEKYQEDTWYQAKSYMPENITLKKRACPQCGAKGFDVNEMEDRTRIISYVPRRIYAKKMICKKCRLEF